MLRLRHLEVEGFRGFPKKSNVFEFNTPAVLIWGDNHQGKSSVLNAIEWCLYGDACIGEKSGIRERVGWEVVNRNSSTASVELALETDTGITTIRRVEVKGKGKRGKRIQVRLPDGTQRESDEAERTISGLLGLSFRDFATTVYQHQETIRDIVIREPAQRNEAIDRLLGLSDYRNILEGVKKAKVAETHKQLMNQLEAFQECVKQALKYRQDDLENKKHKATERGLPDTGLREETLLQLASNIRKQIADFSSDIGVAQVPITVPSKWNDAPSFRDKAKKELDRLWGESPDVQEQRRLNATRSSADRIRTECESVRNAFRTESASLSAIERESGDQAAIEARTADVEGSIENVEQEIQKASPKAKLIEEAIGLLQSAGPETSSDTCPLCGKKDPSLLEHLRKEWTEHIEQRVNSLQSQRTRLVAEKASWETKKAEHSNAERRARFAAGEVVAATKKASEFLARPLTDQDDPVALLNNEIERVDTRLRSIATAIAEKREKLGRISEQIETLTVLHDILENAEKISDIERIDQTEEYGKMETTRDEIAALIEDVQYVDRVLRECLNEEAQGRIGAAGEAIDNYFRKITANPGIRELKVQIDEDKKTGGNAYSFCDQDGQELSPILSQGDLNSLALSMFLGLVKGYAHPIGFIMMDDPSQSLGPAQKTRLVEVVDEVCQSGRSVILGIMDTELQGLLEASLTRAKTIYEISQWTPESGPTVTRKL